MSCRTVKLWYIRYFCLKLDYNYVNLCFKDKCNFNSLILICYLYTFIMRKPIQALPFGYTVCAILLLCS